MRKIGILDDRPGELATTKSIIERNLHDKNWSVVEVPLLSTPAQVVEWLDHEEVNVLIADQVLSDASRTKNVNYVGTEVIKAVRQHLPDMPVYMITAHTDNPDVEPNLDRMEALVKRGSLGKDAPVLVPRMMRAGETFERRNRESLSRLSSLSQKNATASLTKPEQTELKSLQASLAIADTSDTRDLLLPELEKEVQRFAALQAKAAKVLGARPVKK